MITPQPKSVQILLITAILVPGHKNDLAIGTIENIQNQLNQLIQQLTPSYYQNRSWLHTKQTPQQTFTGSL